MPVRSSVRTEIVPNSDKPRTELVTGIVRTTAQNSYEPRTELVTEIVRTTDRPRN
eukprot:CAMPEP_0185782798 /NCGR_PEP_ID=MMETSP1174-20130828/111800_1 /TAXON_ID=35687 /ORGANISM="Dictyocha speculum, Strain CCMP1381" /LENGTH=54 /DNA_ID=CAMNT_0028473479 /DNA_START=195 /DNA_END=359 /DNA_ORIENTATION=+